MIKKILLGLLGFIILVLGIVALYLNSVGMFNKVSIVEKEAGPFVLVYESHYGPYEETASIQTELYEELKEEGIVTTKGFGIYYDNPREVPKQELRSISGVILEGANLERLQELEDLFTIGKLPKSNYVYSEFPFKNQASIFIAIMKVYPKLNAYIKEKEYNQVPVMEVYDVPMKKIEYYTGVNISSDVYTALFDK